MKHIKNVTVAKAEASDEIGDWFDDIGDWFDDLGDGDKKD